MNHSDCFMKKWIKDCIRKVRVLLLRARSGGAPLIETPSTAIVVAPHPDDEVFGCCGLMQRLLGSGKRVELVIMTGGGGSHSGCCSIDEASLIAHRRELTLKAASLYGLSEVHVHYLDFPDGGIAPEHSEAKRLQALLDSLLKDEGDAAVFFPHQEGEGWPDHIRTAEIVSSLCAKNHPKVKRYEYCVWFWFYNCWRIDWKRARLLKMSNEEYRCKQQAIDAYILPKAPCGKPWSGVLPGVFVEANRWSRELYFEVTD